MAAKAILILCAHALLTQVCLINGATTTVRLSSLQPFVVHFGYAPILPSLPSRLGPKGTQSLLKTPVTSLQHQTSSDDYMSWPLVSKTCNGQCSLSQRVCRGVGSPFPLGPQGWPYSGYMAEPLISDPWNRGMGFDNFGYFNPNMDYAAPAFMPFVESPEPCMPYDMPYLMDGMNYGYNAPMMPQMPMMFDPMPVMPGPCPIDPCPMYPDIPVMMDPMMCEPMCMEPMFMEPMCMEPMYMEPMCMEPMYMEPMCMEPMCMEPMCMEPMCMEPMYMEPMCMEPIYPMCPMMEPMCPMMPEPICAMPMQTTEFIAPIRGSPTIAPTASLSVVVMDSSIQNLFENLWNVQH